MGESVVGPWLEVLSSIQEARCQEAAMAQQPRENYGPCGDSCKPWTIHGVTRAPLPCSDFFLVVRRYTLSLTSHRDILESSYLNKKF